MIELTDKTIGIWSVDLMNGSDWLGAARKDGDQYVIEYRFRYHVDDLAFDSKDKKSWYRLSLPAAQYGRDTVIAVVRQIVEAIWIASGGKRYEILMAEGGINELMGRLETWPSISMKLENH